MRQQITIDRIEGCFAVVELPDMTTIDVPLALFPGAKEGDNYIISKADATERRDRIKSKFERLKGDNNNDE